MTSITKKDRGADHFFRFIIGTGSSIILGIVGAGLYALSTAAGWWTLIIIIGGFMVICLVYAIGWAIDAYMTKHHP